VKTWDLEREYKELLDFVTEGREQRKGDIKKAVECIREEFLAGGDRALVEFSRRWDGWEQAYPLKFREEELAESLSLIPRKDVAVLKGMVRNVTAYHRGQKWPKRIYKQKGLKVTEELIPVEKTLVYVPGGTAPYPSSLVMGTVPAQIAGVKHIAVATPAKNGVVNPYILACSHLLGIRDVYRIGGAQAIYAFSYGTGTIPKVDMIVGPGNAFVEEAKRDVYGRVGIDMLAGPTELIILCTESFSPDAIAWDLFSQAEHDEMATVGLFCPDRGQLNAVRTSMERLMGTNRRRAVIEKALEKNSFFVHYEDVEKAVAAINAIAPEHMELIGDERQAKEILYPGILYVGPYTTVAMGDYYIGTNHVLPTGGSGRFIGGLSVDRFMRRKVVVKIDREFLGAHGNQARRLAEIEGLFAHGEAIRIRKES
jgi:histidinol dehydrogenase